jgi:MoaA/NifB/PqqE/SkfB family radical SAM enzyme
MEAILCPTLYCNFNCKHCGLRKSKRKKYITLSLVKKIIKILKENNIKKIVITGGGEPTSNLKKLFKICELLKKENIQIDLVTNGSFLCDDPRNFSKKLKNMGIRSITISFDIFHQPFISLAKLSNLIKYLERKDLLVLFNSVCSPSTFRKNIRLYKSLATFLQRKFLKLPLLPFGIIFSSNKILLVRFPSLEKTIFNEKNELEWKEKNVKFLLFSECERMLTFYPNGFILPCCSMHVMNFPHFFYIARINKKIVVNEKNLRFFDYLQKNKLSFLKLYLKLSRDKDIKEEIWNSKFYSLCDFCHFLWNYKNICESKPEPSFFEISYFILTNFPYFVFSKIYFFLMRGFLKLLKNLPKVMIF